MKRRAAAIIAAGIFAVLLAFCVGWSLSQRSGATTVRLSELQARSHAAPQTTQSQIDLPEPGRLSNYPVHRYDVDGGYLYIPISGWTKSDTSDSASPYWEWTSAYNTGSIFSIVYDEKSLDVQRAEAEEIGFTPVDAGKLVWRLDPPAEGAHIRYYFYPAAGGGCWTVSTLWTDLGISDYPYIFIEPQVMNLMVESFVPSDDFVPPASRPRQAVMKETLVSELSGGAIQTELTVQYTVELNEYGLYAIRSIDSAQARKLSGWTAVSASAEILQDQIVYARCPVQNTNDFRLLYQIELDVLAACRL